MKATQQEEPLLSFHFTQTGSHTLHEMSLSRKLSCPDFVLIMRCQT